MMIWWGAPIDGNLHKDHQLGPGCQVAKGAMDWAALEIWEESKKCLEVSGSRSWDMLGPCILSHVFLKSSEITISWVGKSNCAVDFAGPGNSMAKNTSHHLSVVDIDGTQLWPVTPRGFYSYPVAKFHGIPWHPLHFNHVPKQQTPRREFIPGTTALPGTAPAATPGWSFHTKHWHFVDKKWLLMQPKWGRVWMCYGFLGENRALSRLRTSIEGNKLL